MAAWKNQNTQMAAALRTFAQEDMSACAEWLILYTTYTDNGQKSRITTENAAGKKFGEARKRIVEEYEAKQKELQAIRDKKLEALKTH